MAELKIQAIETRSVSFPTSGSTCEAYNPASGS